MGYLLEFVLGTAVLVVLFYGARKFDRWRSPQGRMIRRLKAWPFAPISRLPQGLPVRTVGRVRRTDEGLVGPFSGRKCLCYEAIVEERDWDELRTSNWRRIAREVRATGFELRDGSVEATVLVPDGATVELLLRPDRQLRSDVLRSPTPQMEAFLERHGQRTRGLVLPRGLRYLEAVVEDGEKVVVAGLAGRETEPPAAEAEGEEGIPRERWTITAAPDVPLLISDDPDVVGT